MFIFAIVNIFRVFIAGNEESVFNTSGSGIFIIILIIIGLIFDEELLYGLGTAAVLPSFLLSINAIIENDSLFFINAIIFLLGSYSFLFKRISRRWYILIDAAIFEYLIFFPEFSSSWEFLILNFFNQFFITGFSSAVFLSSFFMLFLLILKEKYDRKKQLILRFKTDGRIGGKGPFSNYQTKSEKYLDEKIRNPLIRKYFVPISVISLCLILAVIKILVFGATYMLFTISLFSFVISVILIRIRSPILSSWVISLIPSLLYVMFANIDLESIESIGLLLFIGNALYHILIIFMGFYTLYIRRDGEWEYILIIGLILAEFSYILNLYLPGYIVDLVKLMYIALTGAIIMSILGYLISYYEMLKIEMDIER